MGGYTTNDTVTLRAELLNARRWGTTTIETKITGGRTYQYIEVDTLSITVNPLERWGPILTGDDLWNLFPGDASSGGTVYIGIGGTRVNFTYNTRTTTSPYRFIFSSAKSFTTTYNNNTQIALSWSSTSHIYADVYFII